jgi:hypothetical protein
MRLVGFVTALLLLPALARAQDFEGAAKHFSAAQDAFGKQQFHSAAAEFERAYEITKDPVLLFNIGEAWQKAGEGRKAVASYKAYLKAQPASADRGDVQKRIKLIEQKKFKIPDQSAPAVAVVTPPPPVAVEAPAPSPAPILDEGPGASPAPVVAEAPPPSPAPVAVVAEKPAEASGGLLEDQPASKMRVAAWISLAATVAVLTAGAIFALSSQARADEITRRFQFVDSMGQPREFDELAQKDYRDLKDEGQLYNNLAIGFFSGAGALAVVTTVLFIVDWKKPAKRSALRFEPTVGKDHAGVSLGWSF